jgi:hypothetical protein
MCVLLGKESRRSLEEEGLRLVRAYDPSSTEGGRP